VRGHGERVVEGAGVDALGPDRAGVAVLVSGQAAERLVNDAAVLGGELPRGLDIVGDQGRRDRESELGEALELGGLEKPLSFRSRPLSFRW
jgi:hypothetical protein